MERGGRGSEEEEEESWVLPNRAGFGAFMLGRGVPEAQRLAAALVHPKSPLRGVVLVHAVGTGKTCAAAMATGAFVRSRRKVVVMTPASLRGNFEREMRNPRCPGAPGAVSARGRWVVARKLSDVRERMRGVMQLLVPGAIPASLADPDAGRLQEVVGRPPDEERVARVAAAVWAAMEDAVEFVSYNGLSRSAAAPLSTAAYYEDGLVVIDEAHNFVLSARGDDAVLARVYEAIMAARCRVVLLTATPVLNRSADVASLLNLARGDLTTYVVPGATPDTMQALQAAHPDLAGRVDDVVQDCCTGGALRFTLLPDNFVWSSSSSSSSSADDRRVVFRRGAPPAASVVRGVARLAGVRPSSVAVETTTALPQDPEEFGREYLDKAGLVRRGRRARLASRIRGLVSFLEASTDGYPEVRAPKVVPVEMTEAQTARYIEERAREIRLEGRGAEIYYAYTQAVSNFMWPPGPRPADPSSLRELLAPARLGLYSPKMHRLVTRVTREVGGLKHLVYSRLRSVEAGGVELVALALRAAGWRQVVLKAAPRSGRRRKEEGAGTGTGVTVLEPLGAPDVGWNGRVFVDFSGEDRDLHVRAANGDLDESLPAPVTCLLITASGREGISLRGYGHVHLLEPPFRWTDLQQVQGRAARRNSHAHLPGDLRYVQTLVYVSRFPASSVASVRRALRSRRDETLTSDEKTLAGALRKEVAARDMMALLRDSAIDCPEESGSCMFRA